MARITKLELEQLLTAANAEREALRVRVAELEGNIEVLTKRLASPTTAPAAAAKPAAKVRPTYVPTPEQLAYRGALAAARDLAMRSGRSVRVAA